MNEMEVDCPFDENNNDGSDHLAPTEKNDSMSRRGSILDPELSDDPGDNIDGDEGHRKAVQARRSSLAFVQNIETTPVNDFDSDEDTFADAESDCEPNQFFLDEMLEDSHPERLNLLDYSKNNFVSTGMVPRSDAQNDENDAVNDSDDDKQKYEESITSRNDDIEVNQTLNDTECESTSEGSDGVDDSFGNLPTIKHKENGRRMPLNSYGTSAGVGPGRALLRQPSQRTVWGK